jgi:hypothetical protein
MKKKSSGEGLAMLLPYIAIPAVCLMCLFGNVDFDEAWFFVVLMVFGVIIGTIAIGMTAYGWLEKSHEGEEISGNVPMIIGLIISLVVAFVISQGLPKEEIKTPVETKTGTFSSFFENAKHSSSTAEYYKQNFPMTWGYIYKNADDPYVYVEYYDSVWGDLQRHTGDGIIFETLTRYEQRLVNYPRIGTYIYFATSKTREYHSTAKCYTLLKSKPVSRPASYRYNYTPCSKCVGD